MSLGFDNPRWLWALLVLVPLAWTGFRWFSAMAPVRRWSAVLARTLLVSLIVGMLAGASMVRSTDRIAVIAVVDISGSVRRFGSAGGLDPLARAREFLASAERARQPDDLLGLVVFDARALAVATPTRGEVAGRALEVGSAEGSDLEGALRYAAALLPPDAAGRLVVISDGVQTGGDAARVATELADQGGARGRRVPIDVAPVRYEVTGETGIMSVDAPPRAAGESTVNVRVVLHSTGGGAGTLHLTREGEPMDVNGDEPGTGRRVTLAPGGHVEVLTVPLPDGRVHRFQAVYEPDREGGASVGDVIAENNSAGAVTATPGRGSVLIITTSGAASPIEGLLRGAGIEATTLAPAGVPGDLLSLQAYDAVVLDNVPADALAEEQQELISAFVREMGGGLVMAGGTESFGAGGWKGSPLEPLIPVRLDLPEKLIEPDAAIVLVLDVSGSMGRRVAGAGTQQEVANEAAARAVESLPARDLVGVIAFSDRFRVVVPLSANLDAAGTAERIRALSPLGGTSIGPALEEAGRQLAPATASVKHVIVVSDGQSTDQEELPALALSLADQGIHVSTISVGDQADDRTMEAMALRGGGTFYPVTNAALLPRFFLKAVRVVRSPLVREGPFDPVILREPSPATEGLGTPPPLLGLNLTQWRPEPTIVHAMQTPGGEPLLAHWQVELGQVAAFTSDTGRWAAQWEDWPGFARMWAQLARSMARATGPGRMDLSAETVGDELRLRLEAAGDDGRPLDLLTVPVTVYGPSGEPREVILAQTAPGLYEARAAARESGAYVAVAKPRSGARRLAPVLAGASVASGMEYRALRSDDGLLRRMAEATGGRVVELDDPAAAAALFNRAGVPPSTARAPLWPSLLIWTLGVLLLDLGTRRVAWDRYLPGRRVAGDAAARVRVELSARRRRVAGGGAEWPVAGPLTDEDARHVAARERERRMAQRLAALLAIREPPPDAGTADAAPREVEGTGGLLEAKRRARQRFEESGDDGGAAGTP